MKYFNKVAILVLALLLSGCKGCTWFEGCRNHTVNTATAEKKKDEGIFITVINNTNLTINLVEIKVGEDGPDAIIPEENPDWRNETYLIDDAWKDTDSFKVILTDVYGLHYEKTISVNGNGRYNCSISQDDYVERPGDFTRRLTKKANGD